MNWFWIRLVFGVPLAVLVIVAVLLYFLQDRMIFFARAYSADQLTMIPAKSTELCFTTPEGKQCAWYVPPASADDQTSASVPPRIWIFFGGNASLALYWSNGVAASPDKDAGYVLFDYPGYGNCEGKPSPPSIAKASDAMLGALASHFGITPAELEERAQLCLMGHSMGAAAALDFARRHPVYRLVLAAPFTSLRAMADQAVTPMLGWLCRHDYDNVAALKAIQDKGQPAKVLILHGKDDPIIPISMSQELQQKFPDLIDLQEVKGADHEHVLDGIEDHMAVE